MYMTVIFHGVLYKLETCLEKLLKTSELKCLKCLRIFSWLLQALKIQ